MNSGVCAKDMRICLHEAVQLAGTVSGQTAFDKLVRMATMCGGEEGEISQCDEVVATELNGVEDRAYCQMMKQMESKVKERWHSQTGV